MDFATRLKSAREKANLTRTQLAAKSGVKKGTIVNLEQGRREPLWTTVQALAKALEVPFDELTTELEAKKPAAEKPAIKKPRSK